MLDRQTEGYIILLLDKLDKLNDNLEKISKALEKDKEEKPAKKVLVEDYAYTTPYTTPLEPVPWYVHSPQYNRNPFTSDISGLGNSLNQYNFNIPSSFGDKDEQ